MAMCKSGRHMAPHHILVVLFRIPIGNAEAADLRNGGKDHEFVTLLP
jgi:hypothetical protein